MEVLRRLPRRLVVDNLTIPVPRHATGKPYVERAIPYVRHDFFVISLSPGPNNSFERELRSWLTPNLLLLDDFGLHKLTARQSSDFYDVVAERHRRAAMIITSNRAVPRASGPPVPQARRRASGKPANRSSRDSPL